MMRWADGTAPIIQAKPCGRLITRVEPQLEANGHGCCRQLVADPMVACTAATLIVSTNTKTPGLFLRFRSQFLTFLYRQHGLFSLPMCRSMLYYSLYHGRPEKSKGQAHFWLRITLKRSAWSRTR
jgi:hypothetical protein